MNHTSSLHSSIQAYINYVSELQESINNILHIQRRVEQNLNSIVENETYLDMRRTLNSNRYSTNNLNRNVNVSMPSPTNIQQTTINTNNNSRREINNINRTVRDRVHVSLPRFVTNLPGSIPSDIENEPRFPNRTQYRTYFNNHGIPSYRTYNAGSINVTRNSRLPTRRQINVATETLQFSDVTTEQTNCPISLRPFESDDSILRIIQCGHIFTEDNLRRWFTNNNHCPLCRYDIRQYSPRRAIRNPYNQSRVNRNNRDVSENILNLARPRSNSADGELETSPRNSSDTSNNDLFSNISHEFEENSENEFTFDLSNTDSISNVINHLSTNIAQYLSSSLDLSNVSLSEANDFSLNFLTAIRTIPISENSNNESIFDSSQNFNNDVNYAT